MLKISDRIVLLVKCPKTTVFSNFRILFRSSSDSKESAGKEETVSEKYCEHCTIQMAQNGTVSTNFNFIVTGKCPMNVSVFSLRYLSLRTYRGPSTKRAMQIFFCDECVFCDEIPRTIIRTLPFDIWIVVA